MTWEPLVVAVAPNGARKSQQDHPALPITPEEIAREAAACAEAGAAMLHLHVRDAQGRHSLDVEAYRAAIAAVRRAVGQRMILQATTEAVGVYAPAQQMAMVRELRPEAVSLALRELVPGADAQAEAAPFFEWLARTEILTQFILYSAEDLERLDALAAAGVLPDGRKSVLFVLGRYTPGQVSEPTDLLPFLAANGQGHSWSVCAFGAKEIACATTAAALGGHVRVGFENNFMLPDGTMAESNAALVAAAARGARALGRPLADADAARTIFAA
jgi:uncharacterized protein (DUF849 family)